MEHSFATRAEADEFIAVHHPGAEHLPALTKLLGNPVLLDRDQGIVVRVHDWSDDKEEPVVNVDLTEARGFMRDSDLVDQAGILLEPGDGDPAQVRAVLEELTEVGIVGKPPVWREDPVLGTFLTSDSLRMELESALATVNAVRDHIARTVWMQRSEAGATLTEVAQYLHLEPGTLAAMITADRQRLLDL
jgi:hypothetical protein